MFQVVLQAVPFYRDSPLCSTLLCTDPSGVQACEVLIYLQRLGLCFPKDIVWSTWVVQKHCLTHLTWFTLIFHSPNLPILAKSHSSNSKAMMQCGPCVQINGKYPRISTSTHGLDTQTLPPIPARALSRQCSQTALHHSRTWEEHCCLVSAYSLMSIILTTNNTITKMGHSIIRYSWRRVSMISYSWTLQKLKQPTFITSLFVFQWRSRYPFNIPLRAPERVILQVLNIPSLPFSAHNNVRVPDELQNVHLPSSELIIDTCNHKIPIEGKCPNYEGQAAKGPNGDSENVATQYSRQASRATRSTSATSTILSFSRIWQRLHPVLHQHPITSICSWSKFPWKGEPK